MKVALAADNDSLCSQVAKRFGHAKYYLIVDTDTMEFSTVKNPKHDDHSIIVDIANLGVEIFIVSNIGPHAFEISKSLNLKIMLARKSTIMEALNKFNRNGLELLKAPTMNKSIHEHRRE